MSGKAGVFICPSCQAVVKSDKSLSEGVVCGECQHEFGKSSSVAKEKTQVPGGNRERGSGGVIRDLTAKKSAPILPVGVIDGPKVAAKSLEQARIETAGSSGQEEMIMPDGSRRVRRRKKREKKEKNKGLILFLGGWMCVIVIVFAMFKSGKIGKADPPKPSGDSDGLSLVDRAILEKSRPMITKKFRDFIKLPSESGRVQFIDRSADLSLAFSRYYRANTFPRPESELTQIRANVIRPSEDMIAVESVWIDAEGHKWGALHILDKQKRWKLDWENFAPYSTEAWSRFRDELGSKDGTFRLLARKRRTGDEAKKISISFYRPPGVFEENDEFRNTESPEVDLLTESDLGQEFLRLWANHQNGKEPMGSILGRSLDPNPKNFMRITVRLAWEKNERDESILVLKEIVGPGWFGERILNLRQGAKDAATKEALKKFSESTGNE
mgnify:CR=1 FL=1